MTELLRVACALAVVVAGVLASAGGAAAQTAAAELSDAAVVERDGAVEVWVRLSRPARYQSQLIDTPWRLVIDFLDTAYRWSPRPVPVAVEPVRELRGSQFRVGVARLVVELSRKASYTIDEDREGLRIVLPRTALAAPPAPRVSAPQTPLAGLLLYGVLELDGRAHAYIYDPALGQVRRYAVGDRVGDALVETISARRVVLHAPTGRVELPLHDDRASAAPGPPAAPRPR